MLRSNRIDVNRFQFLMVMLRTFRAILRGNSLEWGKEVDRLLKHDQPVQVLVTMLEDELLAEACGRGQRMAAVLEKLAQANAFSGVDPVIWQQEVRQEREIPERDD